MGDRVSKDNGVTVDNAIKIEITSGQLFDLKKDWTLDELLAYINEKEAKKITELILEKEKLYAKFQLDVGIMIKNNKDKTDALISVANATLKLYPCYIKHQKCEKCLRYMKTESCPAKTIFEQKGMRDAVIFAIYDKIMTGEIKNFDKGKIRRL